MDFSCGECCATAPESVPVDIASFGVNKKVKYTVRMGCLAIFVLVASFKSNAWLCRARRSAVVRYPIAAHRHPSGIPI